MRKNTLIIVALAGTVALAIGGFLVWRSRSASQSVAPTPTPEGVLIETPLEERPYVTLTPRADGREFTLDISRIGNIKTIEYELVYLSNGLSRGVIGSIDLEGESEISRKLLLGTCSRNVCKYDEGVEEGTLTLRFRGPDGTRKFVSDFHLQRRETKLSSVDGNFKLEGKFSLGVFYITMPTIGLPKKIEGEIVGGPYGVFTAGSKLVKNGKATLTLEEETTGVKLYAWTGRAWEEIQEGLEIEGKIISADIDRLATFVVLASE